MLKDTEVLYGKGKSALFWSASLANIVSADQVSAETATELVTNQWEIAEQANEVAQSKTDILADMQAEVENTELTISEDDTQTVVTETDMDITLSDFNELGFLLLDESAETIFAKLALQKRADFPFPYRTSVSFNIMIFYDFSIQNIFNLRNRFRKYFLALFMTSK